MPKHPKTLTEKIEELTYGLIYPAFFSHMVYNWIEICMNEPEKDPTRQTMAIVTGLFLIIYYAIDYWHLKNDLDYIVPHKSWFYMICDIGTSLSLFGAMIFVQHGSLWWALLLFCIVPVLTASYNIQLKFHSIFQWVYMLLAFISFVVFFNLNIISGENDHCFWREIYVSSDVISFTLIYFGYNVICYWSKHAPSIRGAAPAC